MKAYLAPDIMLSYILRKNKNVDSIFDKIIEGKIIGVVSNYAWYEVISCIKKSDKVNYKRLADICFYCEFILFPEKTSLKDMIKNPIKKERIKRLRKIALSY